MTGGQLPDRPKYGLCKTLQLPVEHRTDRRDHKLRIDNTAFQSASSTVQELLPQVLQETDLEALRGWEGAGAAAYFGVFDQMILREKEQFFFRGRNRRPPLVM